MEKKEILQAFKQAEIDWSENYYGDNIGLCTYFKCIKFKTQYAVDEYLKPFWFKFATRPNRVFHFRNQEERLDAIRKVINELENEI